MLNRPLSALLAISVIGFGSAAALASTQAPAQGQTKPAPAAPKPIARTAIVSDLNTNFKILDANGDGAVVLPEIQAAQARAQQNINADYAKRRAAAFQGLDTNKDGQLSPAEFNAGSPPPKLNRPAPATIVQQMDANKDQKITPTEFSAVTLANFDLVDTNRDGIVTPAEAQKFRASRK